MTTAYRERSIATRGASREQRGGGRQGRRRQRIAGWCAATLEGRRSARSERSSLGQAEAPANLAGPSRLRFCLRGCLQSRHSAQARSSVLANGDQLDAETDQLPSFRRGRPPGQSRRNKSRPEAQVRLQSRRGSSIISNSSSVTSEPPAASASARARRKVKPVPNMPAETTVCLAG